MKNKIIDQWMLLLLAVLLTACGDDKEGVSSDEDCYLDIYVYAPDRPIVTRADVGMIEQRIAAESEVKSLQIWVFKHSDGSKVGYLGADDTSQAETPNLTYLNESGQQVYRMKVAKAFANAPEAVDVYVVANAASCGLTLTTSTTRSDLDAAMIGTDYFGMTTRVSAVPDNGLPMSAVAKSQPIHGSFPALRIGSEEKMTTLQLTRAVSKLRFVLCQKKDQNASKRLVSIDEISLDGNQIPEKTYLIPGTYNYSNSHAGSLKYIDNDHKLLENDIPKVVDPLAYAYETQEAQKYENLINEAISGEHKANVGDENLKELGLTYFRESDKQLTGTIKYTYSNNGADQPQETATFSMAAPGDFLRNHSWIVYIYYMDSKIYTLTVTNIGMKSWVTDPLEDSKSVYNW